MRASKYFACMRMYWQASILYVEPIEGVLSAVLNVGQTLGRAKGFVPTLLSAYRRTGD